MAHRPKCLCKRCGHFQRRDERHHYENTWRYGTSTSSSTSVHRYAGSSPAGSLRSPKHKHFWGHRSAAVGFLQSQQRSNRTGFSPERVSFRVAGESAHDFDARESGSHVVRRPEWRFFARPPGPFPNLRGLGAGCREAESSAFSFSDGARGHLPQGHRSLSAERRTDRSGPSNLEFSSRCGRNNRDITDFEHQSRWQHGTTRPVDRSHSAGDLSYTGSFADLSNSAHVFQSPYKAPIAAVSSAHVELDPRVERLNQRPRQ